MVTIDECIKAFKEDTPNIKVVSCKDYGEYYLFTAFIDNVDPDPFYLVDKKTGMVSSYSIAMDPGRYYSAKELLK